MADHQLTIDPPHPNQLTLAGNLPTDVLVEILSRLPLITLSNFRRVCKSWYNGITHPNLAKSHYARHNKSHCIVAIAGATDAYYFGLIDHRVFDNLQCSVTPRRPHYQHDFLGYERLGSVNGLICFAPNDIKQPYCVWNPIIQEYVLLPNSPKYETKAASGFGYDSTNDKYKLVRIISYDDKEPECEIYTLGSGIWRRIEHLPRFVGYDCPRTPCTSEHDGLLYWPPTNFQYIVCLNLSTEEFHPVRLPTTDINHPISQSLCVLDRHLCLGACTVHNTLELWIMKIHEKHGPCWNKEYSFCCLELLPISPCNNIVKLRNGQLLFNSGNELGYNDPENRRNWRPISFQDDAWRVGRWKTILYTGSLISPKAIEGKSRFG